MAPSKKSTKTETPVQESAPIKTETKKTPSKKVDAPVNTETKKTETKKTEKKPVEKKTESPAPAKTPRKKVEKKEESHDEEEVVVTEIDLDKTDSYRTHWPFLRDRRIDSYGEIVKRFID